MTPAGRRRVGAALAGLVTLVAGLEWRRVFDGDTVVVLVVAAAALPTALAVLLATGDRPAGATRTSQAGPAAAPRPLSVTGTLSLALLLAFVLAAVLQAPDAAGLLDGLVHGWSRILTTTLPVPARAELLVLPVVATWASALTGAEVALRSRYPALGLLAPVAAYALALLFGVGGPGSRLAPAAAALVASLAAGVALARVETEPAPTDGGPSGPRMVRARAGRRRAVSRRAVSGGVLVLACTAGALAVGPRLPLAAARQPYDPREAQRPPADQLEAIDPLSLLAGWARDPAPVLFTVTAPRAQRWRLAVRDAYDPDRGWSGSAELRPAGRTLPEGEPTATTEAVEQEVTVEGLQGVWLPAADRPTEVTGIEPLVDPETGVLVGRAGLEEGLRYRVVSAVPAEEPDCARAAAAPLGPRDTASALPPDLVELTGELTRDATSPCARAQLIEDYLTSDAFEFNAEAPSGATLSRLRDLLEPEEGPGTGTSEQFASAFVLMARAAGLPARVVVGFHGGERVDGTYRVRAGDAFAWGEVRFAGLGWVAFDPTPVPGDQPPPPEVAENEVGQDPSGGTSTSTSTTAPVVEGQGPPAGSAEEPAGPAGRLVRIAAVAAGGLVAALAALVAAIALARWRRRRRRSSSPDPSERALGAWRQCVDELRAAGVRPGRSDTAADYVARSRTVVGDAAAEVIAPVGRLANGILFGGPAPSEHDAAAAWRAVHDLTELTAAGRTLADRVRRAVDVRSLVRT